MAHRRQGQLGAANRGSRPPPHLQKRVFALSDVSELTLFCSFLSRTKAQATRIDKGTTQMFDVLRMYGGLFQLLAVAPMFAMRSGL
jgi:hypothetical protein